MKYLSESMEEQAVLQTAAQMCAAARTAPKTRGKDHIQTIVLTGEDKELLAQAMERIGQRESDDAFMAWYGRDANNVRAAQAVVLVGIGKEYRGVAHCGFCGHANCGECKSSGGYCAFAYVDLGIAVSSAASVAADNRVDSRIMYSIGKAAGEMEYIADTLWLGIPVSVSGKSIFFDRSASR